MPASAEERWWGWGRNEDAVEVPAQVLELLREELRMSMRAPHRPVALEAVQLPEPALGAAQRGALEAIVGTENVREDRVARVSHAAGRSYPDLVRLRSGRPEGAPDAVVWPADHGEVRSVLELCAGEGIAVVPFGGGTSVVGGVEPFRGPFAAVIAVDLARMAAVKGLDERSLTVSVGPGLRAPDADRVLAARGLTLGHLPQSYEYISLGGAVATRSAGQASTGFGRIDELVVGMTLAAPAGEIVLEPKPASAAGPRLHDVLVGSEGVLGVITGIDLRVRPLAPLRYEGWFVPSFAEGMEAMRVLEQAECAPAIARLSDEEETRMSLAMAGSGAKARAFAAFLRARRVAGGCLVVAGWAGNDERTAPDRAAAAKILRSHGAVAVGASPARAWASGRFRAPYLRDALLDHGVLVETLETAGQWSNLGRLYAAVRDALHDALARRGTPPLVWCHVSHLYATGASLYFTFLAPQEAGSEIEQWWAAKDAASEAIARTGGTITHHHGVGRHHAPWMAGEVGETGVDLLRAAKARLDPTGIMNPGKLLPEPRG
ncbi:MAG: FAD-binding oxidoreductase [Solirubrobacteraceae bacterium]